MCREPVRQVRPVRKRHVAFLSIQYAHHCPSPERYFRSPQSRSGVRKVAKDRNTPLAKGPEGSLRRPMKNTGCELPLSAPRLVEGMAIFLCACWFSSRHLPLALILWRDLDPCIVSGREPVSGSRVSMSNLLQCQMTPLPARMKSHRVIASPRCSDVVEVLRCIEQRNFGGFDRLDVGLSSYI